MPITLSTPEKPKPSSPRKILLIGPPGSRKTTFGLQFPNVYVEDCDRNLDGPEKYLRSTGWQGTYAYNNVRYDAQNKMREIHDCYNALCDDLTLMANSPKEFEQFQTVFVDSLSHVNEFIIRHVLKMQNKPAKTLEMEARDWSPFKSYAYMLLVARLEQINKHVICSCHEMKLTEADPKKVMEVRVVGYEPFFQGKVGDIIGAFFTDVWRLEVRPGLADKSETWLQTVKHPKCEHLKNSLGLPAELNVTAGFKVLAPYLKGVYPNV